MDMEALCMNTASQEIQSRCHDCSSPNLRLAPGFDRAWRVTSDCKPWPPGGALALCGDCGLVQTLVNEQWQEECHKIYHGYTIYHQSGGADQPTFDNSSGASQGRSEAILKAMQRQSILPASGRWLDIGCGNGALLTACSRALPTGWKLAGYEVSDKYRDLVERIPGVERLYTCPLHEIPGAFDVISLVHVAEHIPAPRKFLASLAPRLSPGGLLLLEVPDCRQNAFALMIADHCSHFSSTMLAHIAASAGYEIVEATVEWVSKEVSVLGRKPAGGTAPPPKPVIQNESEEVFRGWENLQRLVKQVEGLAPRASPLGIFGTSIAATWLDAELDRAAEFFVDEDQNRVGRTHLGRPILAPKDLPADSTVLVALPQPWAGQVAERLGRLQRGLRVVLP
jgi:SAM-dependent methyltransferase